MLFLLLITEISTTLSFNALSLNLLNIYQKIFTRKYLIQIMMDPIKKLQIIFAGGSAQRFASHEGFMYLAHVSSEFNSCKFEASLPTASFSNLLPFLDPAISQAYRQVFQMTKNRTGSTNE